MNILNYLRSQNFAIILAGLSVLVQSFHSFVAFYNVSSLKGSFWGIVQALLFAIVIDLAVLFYTARGKKDIVLMAALTIFVINAYYYYSHLGFTWELLFAGFISILIPVTQYYYSEELTDQQIPAGNNEYHYARIIEDKDEEIDQANDKNQTLIEQNSMLQALVDNTRAELDTACKDKDNIKREFGKAWEEIAQLRAKLATQSLDEIKVEISNKEPEQEQEDRFIARTSSGPKPYNPTTSSTPVV